MPNLESLQIKNIDLDENIAGFQLLANAIKSKQLKRLLFIEAIMTNDETFQLIFKALQGSSIEKLSLETSMLFYRPNLTNLIDILPTMPYLKYLSLAGQSMLNKTQLISILESTEIEYLSLKNVELTDAECIQLSKKLWQTKLKRLDVSLNFLSLNGKIVLLDAIRSKNGLNLFLS